MDVEGGAEEEIRGGQVGVKVQPWVVTKSCCELDFDYPVVNIYSAIGESEILVILRHVQTTQSWCIHSPSPSSLPLL